ncbi:FecR family protein [Pseudobacter ginsenosidimutans]|uniref:FecR family protein n=1 Tax=Pseudobacter ginsenosidimutans TaxID=661488 RepID=A0A4Q7MQK1_9BACT|nr:FecR family protein [Pseudobacter ginsenosidimutans]QEC40295.1 FecR family protein [Pseudobacter ginsenosidimutans]RZS69102.1 FecR family protein [Pseudobacter ginsenosidimutans]
MSAKKPDASRPSIVINLKPRHAKKILVLICTFLFITFPGNLSHQKSKLTPAPGHCVTATFEAGEPTERKLSDGSVVYLYANSELTEIPTGTEDSIHVKLKGEAYFKVIKKAIDQKFIVESEDQILNVVGTHFKVNANKKFTSTTTIEGKVELIVGQSKTILEAGQKSNYTKSDGLTVKRFASEDESKKWLTDDYRFINLSLAEIIKRLNAWHDVNIIIKGPIDNTAFTLNWTNKTTLNSLLDILEITRHLSYSPHFKKYNHGDTIQLKAQ